MLMGNFIFGCQDAGTACPEWWSCTRMKLAEDSYAPFDGDWSHVVQYPLGHGYVERLISVRRAWWSRVCACACLKRSTWDQENCVLPRSA